MPTSDKLLNRIKAKLGIGESADPVTQTAATSSSVQAPEVASQPVVASGPSVEDLTAQITALKADKAELLANGAALVVANKVEKASAEFRILPPSREALAEAYAEIEDNPQATAAIDKFVSTLVPHPYNKSTIAGPLTAAISGELSSEEQAKINKDKVMNSYASGGIH